MLFSEGTILLRSLAVLKAWKLSRILKTGLELGLLKDKVCTTVVLLCRSQERIPPIQLLLILEALSYLFHQMSSRKSEESGTKPFQTLIAPVMQLSVTFQRAVTQLLQRLSQSVSKWVIMFLKLTQINTCIEQTRINASLSFINVDFQEKIRIYSWLVMLS